MTVSKMLYHDMASRDAELDDAFVQWTRTLPAKFWARYDLSACALGWNAALEAVEAFHE